MLSLIDTDYCRLCGEENKNGILIFEPEEGDQNLSQLINKYLPVKLSDDAKYPCKICPGCNIQLDATVEFFKLIINGQQVLRNLLDQVVKSDDQSGETNRDASVLYKEDHPLSLLVEGRTQPKRKRGRPPKKQKTAEEDKAKEESQPEDTVEKEEEEVALPGKRRRKAPKRYQEIVQGKELERIFREEGVIEEDSEDRSPADKLFECNVSVEGGEETEVIGRLETDDGSQGELVIVTKGKGRGRPKGTAGTYLSVCPDCGKHFKCRGKYMAHVFTHLKQKKQKLEAQQENGPKEEKPDLLPDLSDATHVPTLQNEEGATSNSLDEDNVEIKADQQSKETSEESQIEQSDVNTSLLSESTIKTETEESAKERDNTDSTNKEQGTEKQYKCQYCDKTFRNKQNKWMHVKGVHLNEKPFTCEECGKAFPYRRSLSLHSLVHRKAVKYACDLCGKIFRHPSSVMYHKEAEHTNQRYTCLKCDKRFKHKQLLQRHQLVHSSKRPYGCTMCERTFKTRANLLNHLVLHTGVRPYACHLCSQTFAHKTSHSLHLRLHSGEKPFCCTECNKRFTQKGNLVEHQRTHTGEKPYQCTICPRKFTTSSQLRFHQSHHINKEVITNNADKPLKSQLKKSQKPEGNVYKKKPRLVTKSSEEQTIVQLEDVENGPHRKQTNHSLTKQMLLNGQTLLAENNEERNNFIIDADKITIEDGEIRYHGRSLGVDPSSSEVETYSIDGAEIQLQDLYGRKIELGNLNNRIKFVDGEIRLIDDSNARLRLENGELTLEDEIMGVSEIYNEEEECGSIDQELTDDGSVNERDEKDEVIYVTYAQQDYSSVETDDETEEAMITEASSLDNVYTLPGVLNEDGNKIQVSLQNGAPSQIKSFQMISHDGQSYPLEIDNLNNQLEMSEESDGVQILTLDAHYYTVV